MGLPVCSAVGLTCDGDDGSRSRPNVIAEEQASKSRENKGKAGHAPVYGRFLLLFLQAVRLGQASNNTSSNQSQAASISLSCD